MSKENTNHYCSNKCAKDALRVEHKKFDLKCEFCGNEFKHVDGKRRFCSKNCMYEWRKSLHREMRKCLHCGKEYETYKTSDQLFCSNECNRSSDYKKNKLSKWANSSNNHWNNPKIQEKAQTTKIERYGSLSYNNMEKQNDTMMRLYGVHNGFLLNKCSSVGKRISNVQLKLYESIKPHYLDAILEHYLPDVNVSVDIFIPSQNKVIEMYGDYWHCNPKIFESSAYNKSLHMTAEEKWKCDEERINKIKSAGYDVEIVWETDLFPTE